MFPSVSVVVAAPFFELRVAVVGFWMVLVIVTLAVSIETLCVEEDVDVSVSGPVEATLTVLVAIERIVEERSVFFVEIISTGRKGHSVI